MSSVSSSNFIKEYVLSSRSFNWALGPIYDLTGSDKLGWFTDKDLVLPSFIIMSLWGFGGPMLIYLAALQNVPTTLYDAAEVDGAGPIRTFFAVTLPMISPVIFACLPLL